MWLVLAILSSQIVILGPGALSYTPVLEAVASRRLANHWGLTGDIAGYDALAAPADCGLLDKSGWLVAGGKVLTVKIVDCENGEHAGTMDGRNLLADVNREELGHEKAWLVLR